MPVPQLGGLVKVEGIVAIDEAAQRDRPKQTSEGDLRWRVVAALAQLIGCARPSRLAFAAFALLQSGKLRPARRLFPFQVLPGAAASPKTPMRQPKPAGQPMKTKRGRLSRSSGSWLGRGRSDGLSSAALEAGAQATAKVTAKMAVRDCENTLQRRFHMHTFPPYRAHLRVQSAIRDGARQNTDGRSNGPTH